MKVRGFTLIEMVVVIVILGILSVTAYPKFMSLQSDSRKATLQAMKGAINSANGMVYGKATLAGVENQKEARLPLYAGDTKPLSVKYGYPAWSSDSMKRLVTLDDDEWTTYTLLDLGGNEYRIGLKGYYRDAFPQESDIRQCFIGVSFMEKAPVVKIYDRDC